MTYEKAIDDLLEEMDKIMKTYEHENNEIEDLSVSVIRAFNEALVKILKEIYEL